MIRLLVVQSMIYLIVAKASLFDADSGGRPEHLKFTIANLDRLGVSAIVIEDKIVKKNSLSKKVYSQKQDSIKKFCDKIKIAKKSTIFRY